MTVHGIFPGTGVIILMHGLSAKIGGNHMWPFQTCSTSEILENWVQNFEKRFTRKNDLLDHAFIWYDDVNVF
jgi:hypothetical protein